MEMNAAASLELCEWKQAERMISKAYEKDSKIFTHNMAVLRLRMEGKKEKEEGLKLLQSINEEIILLRQAENLILANRGNSLREEAIKI